MLEEDDDENCDAWETRLLMGGWYFEERFWCSGCWLYLIHVYDKYVFYSKLFKEIWGGGGGIKGTTMHPSYQSADVKKGKFLGERNRTPFSKVHFCHNFRRKRRKIITCLWRLLICRLINWLNKSSHGFLGFLDDGFIGCTCGCRSTTRWCRWCRWCRRTWRCGLFNLDLFPFTFAVFFTKDVWLSTGVSLRRPPFKLNDPPWPGVDRILKFRPSTVSKSWAHSEEILSGRRAFDGGTKTEKTMMFDGTFPQMFCSLFVP